MIATLALLLASTIPLRNPCWPVGYMGEREAISDKPKIQIRPTTEATVEEDVKTSVTAEAIAQAEEEADDRHYTDKLWIAARKALLIGATLRATGDDGGYSRQALSINGRIYADGDLVSFNHAGKRFTWKVKTLTEGGTLKLTRVKFRELEEESEDKGTK